MDGENVTTVAGPSTTSLMRRNLPTPLFPTSSVVGTLEDSKYWRHRLSISQQAYDDSEPKVLAQWLSDRCKWVQWYIFWIAVLIIILTIVFAFFQFVSIMLVYYPSHPIKSERR